MFSHLGRTDFNAAEAKHTENLLDILKTAGYRIPWRDNDDGCKGVCGRAEVQSMVKINNPKYCNGKYCHDEALLDGLPELLADIKQDTLIVLHTVGSHGPTYYNRYPDSFKKFAPTCDTADIQNCTREQVINTYDNTILYTDYIVSSAIDMLKSHPEYESGLIYVSDHGESLGENNVYLHGFPYKLAPKEQKHVPMILWMSETMKRWDYVDYACLKKEATQNTYTHDNLFHSIIGLLEVKTHTYNRDLDIFKNCRTKHPPFFEQNAD
jgi:lipid A ethanolaminephosphotransferase